nr:ribonuclease H-like domain-containing protein [Tanacetum cinerariifolium]
MDSEIEKEVMKRSRFNIQQESSKKQKLDEQAEVQVDSDQKEDEMKKYMKIVPGEEIAIDAIPLATKPLVIVECKIIIAETTTNDAGTSTTIIPDLITIEKKAKKKNDVKVRSMLLMILPNEHLMTFNQYKDAKTLFAAIETRFDLEQIHEDDLEKIDLKWQLPLLSMRAKRFFQNTGKKITINGNDITGYDKSKVECFNCHKMGHFVRECRVPKNQDNRTRNQETTRRRINVEYISYKEMVAIDGAGFDWSYMADDEAPTNMAFMALSDSESGLGYVSYNAILPPHTRRFSPLRIDLCHTGLPEFAGPSVKSYRVMPIKVVTQTSSVKIFAHVKENIGGHLLRIGNQMKMMRLGENTIRGKGWPVNPKRNFFKKINTANEKVNTARPNSVVLNVVKENKGKAGHSHKQIEDQGYFDSGCSWHMSRNISYLTDFKEFDGGYVAFRGGTKGGKITSKGTIRTGKLDFEDLYFVKELQFNLFSVSQMCDKKNSVLFTDTECLVLSHDFKLADESYVLLKVPRKNDMYSVDMKNIVPKKDLICLVAKATNDESMLWHRTLATKDETSRILKSFITEIENLVDKKVKINRCGNGTEIKNRVMNEFCEEKGDGPKWLFDIDTLIESMNYVPVSVGTKFNDFAGKGASFDAGQCSLEEGPKQDYILMPLWNDDSLFDSSSKDSDGVNPNTDGPSTKSKIDNQERPNDENSTKDINTVRPSINTISLNINTASLTGNTVRLIDDYFGANNDMRSLDGVELDISNLFTTYHVSTTPNTRINKDHSFNNVIGDMQFGVQTRRMTVTTNEQGFISAIYEEKTRVDLYTYLFACFLSQEEPKRITNALQDPAWVEAMQE